MLQDATYYYSIQRKKDNEHIESILQDIEKEVMHAIENSSYDFVYKFICSERMIQKALQKLESMHFKCTEYDSCIGEYTISFDLDN